MQSFIPIPPSGADISLQSLGIRYTSGLKLNGVDITVATQAAATQNMEKFGPGPAEMKISPPAIPENVAGALVSASI